MQIFIKPQLPPLVVTSAGQFMVCNSAYEFHDWLTPDIMKNSDGFVICDPTGYLHERYANLFKRSGYAVKTFDTSNLRDSNRYNPFAYVRDNRDVAKLVTAFIGGTSGYRYYGDIKFLAAEVALMSALFGYIANEAPSFERNINSVIETLKYMRADDGRDVFNDENYKHAVDFLFEQLEERDPNCFAVQRYTKFKLTAGHFANTVVNSCIWRLEPFAVDAVKDRFTEDELAFDWILQ